MISFQGDLPPPETNWQYLRFFFFLFYNLLFLNAFFIVIKSDFLINLNI